MLSQLVDSNPIYDQLIQNQCLRLSVIVCSLSHDPKKISEKDSIPYQLQKLFVNLQTKNKPCFTKDLLKSFQWNDVDSFQQHDVQ